MRKKTDNILSKKMHAAGCHKPYNNLEDNSDIFKILKKGEKIYIPQNPMPLKLSSLTKAEKIHTSRPA